MKVQGNDAFAGVLGYTGVNNLLSRDGDER
jgi:hypothetical protein